MGLEQQPCRLYAVQDREGAYVLPVPGLNRDRLERVEYHVNELEQSLEVVCQYEDTEGILYTFDLRDETTLQRALKMQELIPVAPETLQERQSGSEE